MTPKIIEVMQYNRQPDAPRYHNHRKVGCVWDLDITDRRDAMKNLLSLCNGC